MGRIFNIGGENLTLGTGNVLAALSSAASPNAGCLLAIRRLEITQNASDTSDQIRGEFATRNNAGTLTMTATSPTPQVAGGPASGLSGNTAPAGAAARSGVNSSADSGGTYTSLNPFNFNNLNGYLWLPTPEERILVPPSTIFVVRLLATPTSTTGWTVSLEFEEVI